MAFRFQIIDSHHTLTNSDKEVFEELQDEIDALIDKDNSPYYDAAHHNKLVEEDKNDKARLRELREMQRQTQWGRLQSYFSIRRKAYEKAYGPGSYPYQNDPDDLREGTRTILILHEEDGQAPRVIGGFRMIFCEKGEDRKLRFENKKQLKDVASLLSYLPIDPDWSQGIKYAVKASYSQAEAFDKGIRHTIRKMKYAEMGGFVIDPAFQGQGIGTQIRTEFFNYLRENGGLDGEAFFVVESTPASLKTTLRAAEASGLPCVVRTDAGALIETSNGTPLPRTIVVLSHDAGFIAKMRSAERNNCASPGSYLQNIAEVEHYIACGRHGENGYGSAYHERLMCQMNHPDANHSGYGIGSRAGSRWR